MDFTKTIINAIKIWVNKQLSFIENKISDLEDRPSAFIQPEEPSETPDGTLWIDTDEESSDIIEIEIDSELNGTSENPVQNKVINAAINNLNTLIGDTAVAEQIENAIASIPEAPVTSVNGQTGDIVINIPSVEGLATETYVNNAIDNIEMPEVPVTSVNGMTGDIQINIPTIEGLATEEYVNNAIAAVDVPVTSVNGMTGDVVIEIPESFSGSWNDLTDKPFGEESSDADAVELYKNENLAFETDDDAYLAEINEAIDFVEGEIYTVEWDGEDYVCTCTVSQSTDDYTMFALGNMGIVSTMYPNTGEPFAMQYMRNSDGTFVCRVASNSTDNMHSIAIYSGGSSIKTLDEKYIPDTIARISDIPEINYPVTSVNGQTGDVIIDVGGNDIFWTEEETAVLYSGTDLDFSNMTIQTTADFEFVEGAEYTMTIDGVANTYTGTKLSYGDISYVYIGNMSSGPLVAVQDGILLIMIQDGGIHSVEISGLKQTYHFDENFARAAQSNWNTEDTNAISYIKNKPFYKVETNAVTLVAQKQRTYVPHYYKEGIFITTVPLLAEPIEGEDYRVGAGEIGQTYYTCKFDIMRGKYLGNLSFVDEQFENTGESICIVFNEGNNDSYDNGPKNERSATIYTTRPVDRGLSFVIGKAYRYEHLDNRYINSYVPRLSGGEDEIAQGQVLMVAETGYPVQWTPVQLPCWLEKGSIITEEFFVNCDAYAWTNCMYGAADEELKDSALFSDYDYTVVWNGISHQITCKAVNWVNGQLSGTIYFLGNLDLYNFGGRYDDESSTTLWPSYDYIPNNNYAELPFLIIKTVQDGEELPGGRIFIQGEESQSATIEIYAGTHQYHQLDEHFIPDTIARVTDIPAFPEMPEINYPVTSVNGQTGDVVIDIPSTEGLATEEYVNSAITNINTYYTKAEIDNMEFITLDEIDAICARTIEVVTPTTGTF